MEELIGFIREVSNISSNGLAALGLIVALAFVGAMTFVVHRLGPKDRPPKDKDKPLKE